MNFSLLVFGIALFTASGFAQRHRLSALNTESPDGKLIQQAVQENDPAKKLAVMEQFMSQFTDNQERRAGGQGAKVLAAIYQRQRSANGRGPVSSRAGELQDGANFQKQAPDCRCRQIQHTVRRYQKSVPGSGIENVKVIKTEFKLP